MYRGLSLQGLPAPGFWGATVIPPQLALKSFISSVGRTFQFNCFDASMYTLNPNTTGRACPPRAAYPRSLT